MAFVDNRADRAAPKMNQIALVHDHSEGKMMTTRIAIDNIT